MTVISLHGLYCQIFVTHFSYSSLLPFLLLSSLSFPPYFPSVLSPSLPSSLSPFSLSLSPVSLDLLAVDLKQITREMKEATAELINNKQNKPLKVTVASLSFNPTVTTENMLCCLFVCLLFVCLFICLFQKFCLETEPRVTRLEADFETGKVC